jgi:hypothetical protein
VWGSVASAALVELPIAFLMFNAARRLIRLSALVAVSETAEAGGDRSDLGQAEEEDYPPLWKIPLFGMRPAAQEQARAAARDRGRAARQDRGRIAQDQARAAPQDQACA